MVNENPKVTVLLSVYNDEKYIPEAIDSILGQTFKDFELLIVDDCSTDGTVDILKSYKDPRIRLVINQENIDITRSLNRGLKLARGTYIARHDSDDVSTPERLEKQFYFLENNNDYAAIGSRTEFVDEEGRNIGYWKQESSAEEIFYALSYRCCLTSSSMMFKKDIVTGLGGYDESSSHAEDYELFYRISRRYKIYVIPLYLVKYRIRPDQRFIINNKPTNQRAFDIASRSGPDKGLLQYLLKMSEGGCFFSRVKLVPELFRFHIKIQEVGTRVGLSRLKLKMVCYKMMVIFVIKVIVGQKGKVFLKKIFRIS
jgi:glycosyltransferase involved in cell wall biosynthesis